MRVPLSEESLPVFEAISSSTRIAIINLLSKKRMNVKELAEALNLSNPVTAKHVNILEKAGIIKTERIPGKAGMQKQSILKVDLIEINFPEKVYPAYEFYDVSVPIGQYVDFYVEPTCGLASITEQIGDYDEPKYFADPRRSEASILWFTKGFVEYKVINPLGNMDRLQMIEITMELSSEFPTGNNNWPSDITFTLNGMEIGTWLSLGDYVDVKGKLNPDWWQSTMNQYGAEVKIRITNHGVWINGKQTLWARMKELSLDKTMYNFKIEVKEEAEHVGGCTIFGDKFGNHPTNIDFKFYYSEKSNLEDDMLLPELPVESV
ncbi:ArsR/SmtB family transcription factor [Jeotgalibaca ciconiae]|uniref:ArsR family transcriptional regulator n=1 Tax=Jeotgalibaca ciconiae TaxID=2496265 RepID=A0A3S9H8B7_9LACT|nr:ArsR family transcriptional regulator [Jeotgalibaca ciconiae]AZP03587.1 ArsR family transcriptional regulator [Jeotgalibaca ciconiae]HJB24785.1 ArsR family transcriptional regulator [Candidatus Jeotgalibaca pullicola]